MNTEESRKQFELSGLTSSLYRNNEPGRYDEYEDPFTQFAWRAWQAAQPQWIPVNDPPKEIGRYWCYVEEQNDIGVSHYQWNCSWNCEEWGSEGLTGVVTHWMPLPVPPTNQEVE